MYISYTTDILDYLILLILDKKTIDMSCILCGFIHHVIMNVYMKCIICHCHTYICHIDFLFDLIP